MLWEICGQASMTFISTFEVSYSLEVKTYIMYIVLFILALGYDIFRWMGHILRALELFFERKTFFDAYGISTELYNYLPF